MATSFSDRIEEILSQYYLYKIKSCKNIPNHVAIIMDGNGRWARKRGLPRTEGHRAATRTIRKIIEGSIQAGIKHLSLFAFSTENWKRPEEEVSTILHLIEEQLKTNLDELNENGVRIKLVGDKLGLPDFLLNSFEEAEKITSSNTNLVLYMLINYSGRKDILHAVNALLKTDVKEEVSEQVFSSHLLEPEMPEPDLIIRTSGEKRISNFYLWQAAYSELYFSPKFFPDFKKHDYFKAIIDFSKRKRRFGGLSEF